MQKILDIGKLMWFIRKKVEKSGETNTSIQGNDLQYHRSERADLHSSAFSGHHPTPCLDGRAGAFPRAGMSKFNMIVPYRCAAGEGSYGGSLDWPCLHDLE